MVAPKTKPARSGLYGGASPQERQADRRRRLMDAALEIIGTDGWSQTTMRGVCERAQVGPRFIYESFENLDALAVAVLDEIVQDTIAQVLDAVGEAPADDLAAQVRAGAGALIAQLTDDPRRARMLFAEAHGSAALARGRTEAVHAIAAALAAQSHRVLEAPADADPHVRAAGLLIAGGIAEMVLAWLQGDLDLTRDELTDLTAELVLVIGTNATAIAERVGRDRG